MYTIQTSDILLVGFGPTGGDEMSLKPLCFVPLAILVGCSGEPAQVDNETRPVTLPNTITPPPGVPANFIMTHNGFFHPSCVITVNNGETVNIDGNIIQGDGSIRKVVPCPFPHYDAAGNPRTGSARAGLGTHLSEQALPNVVLGQWLASNVVFGPAGTNITWFSSVYSVPQNPSSNDGQDVALWGGVEIDVGPNQFEVIQPVLDWGQYYSQWAVRGENCCLGNNDYTSSYYPVSVGNSILGQAYQVYNADCPGWSGEWQLKLVVNGTTRIVFNTCQWYAPMKNVDGGVLEVYGIAHCTDLPAQVAENFTQLSVIDNGHGMNLSPWSSQTTIINPGCNPGAWGSGTQTQVSWKYY